MITITISGVTNTEKLKSLVKDALAKEGYVATNEHDGVYGGTAHSSILTFRAPEAQ